MSVVEKFNFTSLSCTYSTITFELHSLMCVLHVCDVSGKKDPGIPNRFPFKEELLKEAEKRKQQVGGISMR